MIDKKVVLAKFRIANREKTYTEPTRFGRCRTCTFRGVVGINDIYTCCLSGALGLKEDGVRRVEPMGTCDEWVSMVL